MKYLKKRKEKEDVDFCHLFLGSKNSIGVQIKVKKSDESKPLMGYAKLWFGNKFLGTIYDFIYIDSYLLGGLYQMLRVENIFLDFPANTESQFSFLSRRSNDLDDDEIDSYRVSFGTLTDKFSVWAYRHDEDKITILWKIEIRENEFLYRDLKNYPTEIFRYTMQYDRVKDFVERLDRIIKVWNL